MKMTADDYSTYNLRRTQHCDSTVAQTSTSHSTSMSSGYWSAGRMESEKISIFLFSAVVNSDF